MGNRCRFPLKGQPVFKIIKFDVASVKHRFIDEDIAYIFNEKKGAEVEKDLGATQDR